MNRRCAHADVRVLQLEAKTVLIVDVPRATRKQRPVYLTTNPFAGHTFRRLNDGDRPLPDDEVKRMLAEQVEDTRDNRILGGYDLDDIDMETFRAYRQVFSNREPGHLWNTHGDHEFLRQIGGWCNDRETGESGLTLAGLLMFGQMAAIQEQLPNYMLDYQERPESKTEARWIDRLTLDGKWSGNLYDFFLKVYLKLTADLKVPFRLEKGERKDETPVHEALREALVNVLVHADYSDRASVLVVKRPDMFGFRNPGLMRIPVDGGMKIDRVFLAGLLLFLPSISIAADFEVVGWTGNGEIAWEDSNSNCQYRVEWASDVAGPWTNSWNMLNGITGTGSGIITASVPMVYRVVAVLPPPIPDSNMVTCGGWHTASD